MTDVPEELDNIQMVITRLGIRPLVVGPLTSWVQLSLSPEKFEASDPWNFIVGRVSASCRKPVCLSGRSRLSRTNGGLIAVIVQ